MESLNAIALGLILAGVALFMFININRIGEIWEFCGFMLSAVFMCFIIKKIILDFKKV